MFFLLFEVSLPRGVPAGSVLHDRTWKPQCPVMALPITQALLALSCLHPSVAVAAFTAARFSAVVCYKAGKLRHLAQRGIPSDSKEIRGHLWADSFISSRGRKYLWNITWFLLFALWIACHVRIASAKYQAGVWVFCVVVLWGINGRALNGGTQGSLPTAACHFVKQLWV